MTVSDPLVLCAYGYEPMSKLGKKLIAAAREGATMARTETALDIVWGCKAIAKAIGRTERATFHMLEKGTLPGARKVAGRWCFSPGLFAVHMAASGDESC